MRLISTEGGGLEGQEVSVRERGSWCLRNRAREKGTEVGGARLK